MGYDFPTHPASQNREVLQDFFLQGKWWGKKRLGWGKTPWVMLTPWIHLKTVGICWVYGCFRKWEYPQIIHFDRVFHYKPSMLGYHYFWKHPYHQNLRFWVVVSKILFVLNPKFGGDEPILTNKKRGLKPPTREVLDGFSKINGGNKAIWCIPAFPHPFECSQPSTEGNDLWVFFFQKFHCWFGAR